MGTVRFEKIYDPLANMLAASRRYHAERRRRHSHILAVGDR